jgi:hypothetical protein
MRETRATFNAAMDQAIPHSAGDSASGRAETTILFQKHFAQSAKCF